MNTGDGEMPVIGVDGPLRAHGYLPGNYENRCVDCRKQFTGAKRAWRCEPCAQDRERRHAESR